MPSSKLLIPSYLHGTFDSVSRKAYEEGLQCGEQYLKDGSFLAPRDLVEVPAGEVLIADEVLDFSPWQPAWRLYMQLGVGRGISAATNYQNTFRMRDELEVFLQETAWGAIYYVTSPNLPLSAVHTATVIKAVLRFWEPLQSVRYLYKVLGVPHTLEELLVVACDWVVDAWCPTRGGSIRECLCAAVERMAHPTREESIEAILRQLPRVRAGARGVDHLDVLTDPEVFLHRIAALDPESFERVSGADPSEILGLLYTWDRQMAKQ